VRKTKGFSYDPDKDKDIIDHIDSQQNGSQYIWNLVKADMSENDIESIVKRHIEKYLQGYELQVGKENRTIDVDINEISNILNL
jgi:hypothetical protein